MLLNSNSLAETVVFEAPPTPFAPPRGIGPWLMKRILRCLDSGRITIVTPSGERLEHRAGKPGPAATMVLHDWRAVRRLLVAGDLGFAEGYIAGDWSTPDLVALIALVAENVAQFQRAMDGIPAMRLLNRTRHVFRRNSRKGSRRNIAFHYDLGNDFYRCWLDESMTYSSACAVKPDQSLEAAQQAKLARVTDLLDLDGNERVLEIGCGWGALAAHLGARCAGVTGLTLSREQLAFAAERIARSGLAQRVDLRLEDYRDTQGTFDRIVSIEMLEAVGEHYWPVYFDTLRARLAQRGKAVLQVITIREDRFEPYRRAPDFIQRYVFPGGMLPTQRIVAEQAARAGFRIASVETFGAGYAATLAEWRCRFEAAWPAIATLGFDTNFHRMWTYYLSYCEAGFRTGTIDVGLYVLERQA
jgi:cyclopropane-fatty-acyl-phospholipid synthase